MQPLRSLAAAAVVAAVFHVADAFVERPQGHQRPTFVRRPRGFLRPASFLSQSRNPKLRQVASSRYRESNVPQLLAVANHGKLDMLGMTAPLSEYGYQQVLELKDDIQMNAFILRVIQKYDGDVLGEGSLMGMIPFYSGIKAESSFSGLISDLIRATWLSGFRDASQVDLNEDGFRSVAEMHNEDEMRAFIRRVIAQHGGTISEETQLFDMASRIVHAPTSNSSYEQLSTMLNSSEWVTNFLRVPQTATFKQLNASTKPPGNFVKDTSDNDQLLFIGVFSAPSNFARRAEVRNSWMQDEIFKGKQPIVSTKFVIGHTDDADLQFQVDEESRMHGDILHLPVLDTYENLPNKSVAYFRWFSQKYCCLEPSEAHWYVMKLDDDSWPNLDLLLPFIDTVKDTPSSLNYIGGLLWNGPVMREGKWAETADISVFRLGQYPAYAAGSGYILSMDVVRHLDKVIEQRGYASPSATPNMVPSGTGEENLPAFVLLRNEDTTIGNFIYQEHHLTMSVNYHDINFREYGCEHGLHIAMNLCPGEMRCMWEKRLNGTAVEDMCCNPPDQYGLPAEGCSD